MANLPAKYLKVFLWFWSYICFFRRFWPTQKSISRIILAYPILSQVFLYLKSSLVWEKFFDGAKISNTSKQKSESEILTPAKVQRIRIYCLKFELWKIFFKTRHVWCMEKNDDVACSLWKIQHHHNQFYFRNLSQIFT